MTMRSSVIHKNPDKPVNHKPAIALGAVVAYNVLKSKSKESQSSSSNNSYSYGVSGGSGVSDRAGDIVARCVIFAILAPAIAILVGLLTNALIGFISIPVIWFLCIVCFIYALCIKE